MTSANDFDQGFISTDKKQHTNRIKAMGRQVQFHALPEDCRQLLDFIQRRHPVVIIDWTSDSARIDELQSTCERGGWHCLWNQALLPHLTRKFIPESNRGPYFRVDMLCP